MKRTDHKLTEEEKQKIKEMYAKGIRTRSIPILMGLTYGQVKNFIYKEVKINRNRNWTMADLNEIYRLYVEENKSCIEIGEIFGVSPKSIIMMMKNNGMKLLDIKKHRKCPRQNQQRAIRKSND